MRKPVPLVLIKAFQTGGKLVVNSTMFVMLATLFVVIALWDTHRLLALGIPAIVFLLAATLAWLIVLGKTRARPRLFAASLAELSEDRKELTSRS